MNFRKCLGIFQKVKAKRMCIYIKKYTESRSHRGCPLALRIRYLKEVAVSVILVVVVVVKTTCMVWQHLICPSSYHYFTSLTSLPLLFYLSSYINHSMSAFVLSTWFFHFYSNVFFLPSFLGQGKITSRAIRWRKGTYW